MGAATPLSTNKIRNKTMREDIWARLILQIQEDLDYGDFTAIYEMLDVLPDDALQKYLPAEPRAPIREIDNG